jgi:two-component system sensor histidine kinase GlrK
MGHHAAHAFPHKVYFRITLVIFRFFSSPRRLLADRVMKINILKRCAIGYLSLFLLLAGSNFYSVWKLYQLGTVTIPALNTSIRIIDLQKNMVDSILSQLRYQQKYLIMHDAAMHDQFIQANNDFHGLLTQVSSMADSGTKRDSVARIESLVGQYKVLASFEIGLAKVKSLHGIKLYEVEKGVASDGILDELEKLEGYARQDVDRRMVLAIETAHSALLIASGVSLVTLLIALFIGFAITRSITGPLAQLVGKTKEISDGVFKSNLRIQSPPEVAELARAFNSMCDKLSEVDKMKNDFLSTISHELRTPLTTIKEGTSLLIEKIGGDITEKQERLLRILAVETNRLIGMVNSILDLSKMEAGMMSYTFEESDIAPLIDRAMMEITPLAESKKIHLRKVLGDDLRTLTIDEDRILQALRNLIGNAAKFSHDNGCITVSAKTIESGVEVSIEDSGPGISAERLPLIFQKFSGSDHKKGTGLGLAIVKHIIEVHGGKVWAESKLKQGSKFTFVLPSS